MDDESNVGVVVPCAEGARAYHDRTLSRAPVLVVLGSGGIARVLRSIVEWPVGLSMCGLRLVYVYANLWTAHPLGQTFAVFHVSHEYQASVLGGPLLALLRHDLDGLGL